MLGLAAAHQQGQDDEAQFTHIAFLIFSVTATYNTIPPVLEFLQAQPTNHLEYIQANSFSIDSQTDTSADKYVEIQ